MEITQESRVKNQTNIKRPNYYEDKESIQESHDMSPTSTIKRLLFSGEKRSLINQYHIFGYSNTKPITPK